MVVTGGTGFCGTALVRHLARTIAQTTDQPVVALDWLPPAAPVPGAHFVRADVRDQRAVRRALLHGPAGSRGPADTVFHLAAIPSIARAPEGEYDSINAGGTAVVCRLARELGVRRLVHVSSSTVYGAPRRGRDQPYAELPECTPLAPAHPYSRSKHAAEQAVRDAARAGLDAVILRPRVVVGPGRAGVFGLLFQLVAAGLPVPLPGGGRNRFQFTAVDDLVQACLLAAEARPADFHTLHGSHGSHGSPMSHGPPRPLKTPIYNVGSEVRRPLRAELGALIAHAGSPSRVVGVPVGPLTAALTLGHRLGVGPMVPEQLQVFAADFVLDTRRAKRALGFAPRHANVTGLLQAWDAWRARGGRPSLAELRRVWRARSQNSTQRRSA